ncbi:hypothetical protein JHK86_045610 [Glycine max]|nr:hypothetical protein JHK86_045610 [Glycine max]
MNAMLCCDLHAYPYNMIHEFMSMHFLENLKYQYFIWDTGTKMLLVCIPRRKLFASLQQYSCCLLSYILL